jgi:serine/threonine protein kinase
VIRKHQENGTRIQQAQIKKWTVDILEALDFLHSKHVVHLDIKPANLFMDELENIIIGDVGIARDINAILAAYKNTATVCYVCPQLIAGDSVSGKSDIW